ncbi:MAG: M20/M25/M40 family metallo-hydrolase [Proteobacteria bacterium]|nr:M20/M25/M40 family metallo-hydrolase [Pseudomonadota bacterium]
MLDILQQLIEIDTTTARDTVDAAAYVRDRIVRAGGDAHLAYNPGKTRAGVVGIIGDPRQPGVVFSGHLDVVPADAGMFRVRHVGSRLYGRGTCDMKGAIATLLSLLPEMAASGKTFRFAFTHDEETGGSGINDVLAAADLKNASGCIVMEPTENRIVLGQKTSTHGEIHITGRAAHSSNPENGVDAIKHAVRIYEIFTEKLCPFQSRADPAFTVPHSVATICRFSAGTAQNIIADFAKLEYSARFLNNESEQKFFANLDAAIAEYAQTIDGLSVKSFRPAHLPAFDTPNDAPFVAGLAAFAETAKIPKVSYGTEAGHYAAMGIPTVVLGPGSIDQAHTADEFVEIGQLETFRNILKNVIAFA